MVEMMGLEVVAEMMGLEQRLKYNGRSSVNFSAYCLNVQPQVCPAGVSVQSGRAVQHHSTLV